MPRQETTRRVVSNKSKGQRGGAVTVAQDVTPKQTSFHDAATIQDRIRMWQTQDIVEAVDPDVLSVRSLPESNIGNPSKASPLPCPTRDEIKEAQTTSRTRSTKWVQQENQAWVKQRRSTRRDKSKHIEKDALIHEHHSTDERVEQGAPQPDHERSDTQRIRNVNRSRAEREERRKRRREIRAHTNAANAANAGVRLESHLDSDRDYDNLTPARSMVDSDQDTHPMHPAARDVQPSSNYGGLLSSDRAGSASEDDVQMGPSKYAQTLGQPSEYSTTFGDINPKKRAILNRTRDFLAGRTDPPPAGSNRIPSIEAWLDEQPGIPDPSRGKQGTMVQEQHQSPPPPPPKHRSHRVAKPAVPTIVEVDDPNKIWESLHTVQQTQTKKPSRRDKRNDFSKDTETSMPKRRLFSFEVCDEPSKGEKSAPPPPNYAEDEDHSTLNPQRKESSTVRRQRRDAKSTAATEILQELVPVGLTRENSIQPDRDISPKRRTIPSQLSASSPTKKIPSHDDAGLYLSRSLSNGLKRKLTTHEDMLSILSKTKTKRPTRSVRSGHKTGTPSHETTIEEVLKTMCEEEVKYTRELKTLVDGVTPVLLQSILSKTDVADLFSDGRGTDAVVTRPIIDMGVALQRLKKLHNRIPLQDQKNAEGLLAWAITAHKPYGDYVKSWRLGFQGIIVNLAPLEQSELGEADMLDRDVDGDVTDEQGQKVDVAYLQKRPLVRIKRMSKLFAALRDLMPSHEKAQKVAELYAELTEIAKQRHCEEQGRLEDEAAANTDITRARDIKTMAPLERVNMDKGKKVRARDYFDLSLCHSTGQRWDCKIEIILRDDPSAGGSGGDILICQIEEDMKWLLFQPIQLSNVSTRRDQSESELVLMIRGMTGVSTTWVELLALKTDDREAITEWLHMLGSNPLPSKLNHEPSWRLPEEPQQGMYQDDHDPAVAKISLTANALANLPTDIDIPIGEPSVISPNKRSKALPQSALSQEARNDRAPKLGMGGGLQKRRLPEHVQYAAALPISNPLATSLNSSAQSSISRPSSLPLRTKEPSRPPALPTPTASIVSQDTNRESTPSQSHYSPQKFSQPSDNPVATSGGSRTVQPRTVPSKAHGSPQKPRPLDKELEEGHKNNEASLMSGALRPLELDPERHLDRDAKQAVPNVGADGEIFQDTPPNSKHSRVKSFSSTPLTDTIREQWATLSGFRKKNRSTPNTPERKPPTPELVTDDLPDIRGPPKANGAMNAVQIEDHPPPPPPHQSNMRKSVISATPIFDPFQESHYDSITYAETRVLGHQKYHSHSSASASYTESDSDETDATSDASDDDLASEVKDQATPLVHVGNTRRHPSNNPNNPRSNIPSTGTRTLDPSDSASNGPYRRAPPPSSFPAHKKKRTIAMVCSWSDRGVWEPIRNDECSIVISPGLVQAFPMTAEHSQPMSGADWEMDDNEISTDTDHQQPLVEFELTPVVPLRKGTALDITIRSPPTSNSTIRTTNNVMFRSRTVQECEKLYHMINWARCNNPTYAQLAQSRAREQTVTFATNVPQTRSKSWFSFGSREKVSYRASSRPPTSIADTAATGSTTTSAFSALKKFGTNSPFSLKRSSVIRKGTFVHAADSLYSSSNGGSGSGTSTPVPSQAGFIPGPEGPNVPQTSAEAANGGGMVNKMKIHLFVRQEQKWEALGQSFLTVLPAAIPMEEIGAANDGTSTPPQRTSTAPSSMPRPKTENFRLPSSSNTPHRIHGDGREKRVLITSMKKKEAILLDEVLGESCFEKVMQTGIAVKVWKEDIEMQEYGGVLTGRSKTYMMQFRTSTEASWVFNMCGTYRYGDGGVI